LANIKAQSISNLDEPIWVFNDADNFKLFQCLQNGNDNVEWKKDQNYAGSNYLTFGGQIPDYLNDNTNKAFYQILNLPYLWSTELFNKDTKTPLYRPFAKDTETIVTISYLITFSPKPWTNEAPPIAFYVYANLRCGGIA
jgi:hypothetical protein